MLTSIILVLIPAMLAGLIQGVTGFGSGIILMIFLPIVFSVSKSAGLATLMMSIATLTVVLRYRKQIQWKQVIVPFAIYAITATFAIQIGQKLSTDLLKVLLGLLLVGLCTYFIWSPLKETQSFSWWIVAIFMVISGFFNGLLGIGGPLVALYFLTKSKTPEMYLGTLQVFFLLDMIYVSCIRVSQHIVNGHDLPFIIVGMVGTTLGVLIAQRIVQRLNIEKVRQITYILIGCSGIYYLFSVFVK